MTIIMIMIPLNEFPMFSEAK